MEDTLGEQCYEYQKSKRLCLNPCFNGRYSRRTPSFCCQPLSEGLNPCFNGRYSRRTVEEYEKVFFEGLNPCFNGRYSRSPKYFEDDDNIES